MNMIDPPMFPRRRVPVPEWNPTRPQESPSMTNATPAPEARTDSPDQSERLRRLGGAPPAERPDEAAYDELLGRVCAAVKPNGVIEERHVRDVVDEVWEAMQLRRLKAHLMGAAAHEGLEDLLRLLPYGAAALDLADRWVAREPRALEEVDARLAAMGLTLDAAMAEASLFMEFDVVEDVDHLIGKAEARRNAALRNIDVSREDFARALRHAAREAEKHELEAPAAPGAMAGESTA